MLIVYQSLNSGNQRVGTSSADTSALDGRFTRDAHDSYPKNFYMWDTQSSRPVQSQVDGLYPHAEPIGIGSSGSLVSLSSHKTPGQSGIATNRELVSKVIDHILNELEPYGEPEVIVLGEVFLKDTGRTDYVVWNHYDNKLACQSFTALIRSRTRTFHSLKILPSKSTPSYPMLELSEHGASLKIAFVHIPNKYIRDTSAVADFLADAKENADIIIGDTNLRSGEKLAEVGVKLWGTTTSAFPIGDAHEATLHPGPQGKGTSSTEDFLYDRGISRRPGSSFGSAVVDHHAGVEGPQPVYQFLGVLSKRIRVGQKAITFSDHNGLAISIVEPRLRPLLTEVEPVKVPERGVLTWRNAGAVAVFALAVWGFVSVLSALLARSNLAQAEQEWLSSLTNKPDYDLRKELLRANGGHLRERLAAMAEAVRLPELGGAVRGSNGAVTLIPEVDHIRDHADNVGELISAMRARGTGRNEQEVIVLERQNGAGNLGMRDVVLLADLLLESTGVLRDVRIPEEIVNSPIFYDALLLNAARKHGVHVMGIDSDGGAPPSTSAANEAGREAHMAQSIRDLLAKGYNVTALIGAAHVAHLRSYAQSA